MSESKGHAAPESGDEVTVEQLSADPEIAALLDFEPVPRKVKRPDGWTPQLQRQFIAWLAHEGTAPRAAGRMGKKASGIEALYNQKGVDSFRASWDAAIELALARAQERDRDAPALVGRAPGMNARPSTGSGRAGAAGDGHGEWESEASLRRREEQAADSICEKLLRIRRLYLAEISACPGKRAAFEILTELPIDWKKAKRGEPQDDEPYRTGNQREADMVLMAESGWSWGGIGYGPDRKADIRAKLDAWRAEHGMEPLDWDAVDEAGENEAAPEAPAEERPLPRVVRL